MLLVSIIGVIALLAAGISAPAAWAHARTKTFRIHNGTQTMVDRVPCIRDKATFTITFNEVFHRTTVAPHLVHVTDTMTGTFVAVPLRPSRPTFRGHFTSWDGFNSNRQSRTFTFTFSIHGLGSDGSHLVFHEVTHFTMSASGATLQFDKPTCSSP